jgi:hypothetical protein
MLEDLSEQFPKAEELFEAVRTVMGREQVGGGVLPKRVSTRRSLFEKRPAA